MYLQARGADVGEGLAVTERVGVFVTEGLRDVVGLVEGGTPIVPRKLYEQVGLSLTNEYPVVAPYE